MHESTLVGLPAVARNFRRWWGADGIARLGLLQLREVSSNPVRYKPVWARSLAGFLGGLILSAAWRSGWTHSFASHPYGWFAFVEEPDSESLLGRAAARYSYLRSVTPRVGSILTFSPINPTPQTWNTLERLSSEGVITPEKSLQLAQRQSSPERLSLGSRRGASCKKTRAKSGSKCVPAPSRNTASASETGRASR